MVMCLAAVVEGLKNEGRLMKGLNGDIRRDNDRLLYLEEDFLDDQLRHAHNGVPRQIKPLY